MAGSPATNPVHWCLRPADASDEAFFLGLRAQVMGPYWRTEFGGGEQPTNDFRPDRTRIVVVDGEQAGALHVDPRPSRLWIRWLLIDADHQGRGLGSDLVQLVKHEAAAASLDVGLEVLPCNVRARRLYERLGFRAELVIPYSVRMRWRVGCDPFPGRIDSLECSSSWREPCQS